MFNRESQQERPKKFARILFSGLPALGYSALGAQHSTVKARRVVIYLWHGSLLTGTNTMQDSVGDSALVSPTTSAKAQSEPHWESASFEGETIYQFYAFSSLINRKT